MSDMGNVPWASMLMLTVLFVVVSNQQTYEIVSGLVNQVLPDVEVVDENGQPTLLGQFLHGFVLSLVVFLLNTQLGHDLKIILH